MCHSSLMRTCWGNASEIMFMAEWRDRRPSYLTYSLETCWKMNDLTCWNYNWLINSSYFLISQMKPLSWGYALCVPL